MSDPDVWVTRDAEGCWRIEGRPDVVICNLTPEPPLPVTDLIWHKTGRWPAGYVRVRGERGLMRFHVRWE